MLQPSNWKGPSLSIRIMFVARPSDATEAKRGAAKAGAWSCTRDRWATGGSVVEALGKSHVAPTNPKLIIVG